MKKYFSFEKIPDNYMTIEEVEDFLGISYQTFKKELKSSNYDYSSGNAGMPRNLYFREEVMTYDKKYHYSINKDRINVKKVAEILNRSVLWVRKNIKPTDQVVRGTKTMRFYDKELIQQFIDTKNGIIYHKPSEIQALKNKIFELEKKLESQEVEVNVFDLIGALEKIVPNLKLKGIDALYMKYYNTL